jgi:hypothetical protein
MQSHLNYLTKLSTTSIIFLFLQGCAYTDDVKTEDNHVLYYKVSAAKDIPDTSLGLMIEAQGTKGEGTQFFSEEEIRPYVHSKPVQIRPAVTTQNEFSLRSTSIVGKWNALNNSHVGINVYLGGIDLDAHVKVIEPSGKTTELQHRTHTVTQKFEMYWPITPKLKVTGGIAESFRSDFEARTFSLSLDYQLTKAFEFSLGYNKWTYDFSDDSFQINVQGSSGTAENDSGLIFNSHSEISLDTAGVQAGVGFKF